MIYLLVILSLTNSAVFGGYYAPAVASYPTLRACERAAAQVVKKANAEGAAVKAFCLNPDMPD